MCQNYLKDTVQQNLMPHILIIDDDAELSSMLGDYLANEGFDIDHAYDGEQGVNKALSYQYDAVILDVMMPRLDGFEALRIIRNKSEVPVLMLTAKGDEVDRIVGLEIGADDYLPKPFSPRELLARIRAVLRRTQSDNDYPRKDKVQHVGELEINPSSRTVIAHGQTLDLTSTEFNLLETLAKQAGQVVSKKYLSEHGMGRPMEKYDRSIDMHMSNLRKKLARHNLGSMIITVRGQGYQLSGDT